LQAGDCGEHLGGLEGMLIAAIASFDFGVLDPEGIKGVSGAGMAGGYGDFAGANARQDSIYIFAEGGELNAGLRVKCGPLIEQAGWILADEGSDGVVVSAAENERGCSLGGDWVFGLEEFLQPR